LDLLGYSDFRVKLWAVSGKVIFVCTQEDWVLGYDLVGNELVYTFDFRASECAGAPQTSITALALEIDHRLLCIGNSDGGLYYLDFDILRRTPKCSLGKRSALWSYVNTRNGHLDWTSNFANTNSNNNTSSTVVTVSDYDANLNLSGANSPNLMLTTRPAIMRSAIFRINTAEIQWGEPCDPNKPAMASKYLLSVSEEHIFIYKIKFTAMKRVKILQNIHENHSRIDFISINKNYSQLVTCGMKDRNLYFTEIFNPERKKIYRNYFGQEQKTSIISPKNDFSGNRFILRLTNGDTKIYRANNFAIKSEIMVPLKKVPDEKIEFCQFSPNNSSVVAY
jgi:hypothetical protein